MVQLNFLRAPAALALALVSLSACGESLGLARREPVSLSIATVPPSDASGNALAATPAALDIVAGNGHVLDLQHADLTLEDVRLGRQHDDNDRDTDSDEGDSDGESDSDSDSDNDNDDDHPAFNTGPLTIELPLGGGVITPITRSLPVGTYDELEAELAFLRLRGTYDGAAFDVTLAIDREIERELVPPLVVRPGDGDANVTLSVAFIHCFRDANGTPIDPRRLQTDAALRASLRACIAHAFHAFEDHDRDADDRDSDSDD